MNAERWRQIHDLFEAARTRPAGGRDAFLREACRGDEALARQLAELLDAHDRAGTFLEAGALTDGFRALAADPPTAGRVLAPTGVAAEIGAFRTGSDFRGTERYTLIRRLGAGGMGVVYEVLDRERSEAVALKTLLRASAAAIYRFKREFRSLADVAHTNLVSLYELVVEGEHCFFTMELVKGVNLVHYVRGTSAAGTLAPESSDRARTVLRQLVDGLSALHRKGKLHRDIKPSNVLVTPDSRVVILDFGLISDADRGDAGDLESLAGTPAYIAPEQGPGVVPSETNDWYSVGVTLYEALTGRLPFDGSPYELLRRKKEVNPPAPVDIAPDVPDDLNAICVGLLQRDPEQRLSGLDVIRRLEGDDAARQLRERASSYAEPAFVGRERQLDILHRALAGATHGRAGVVCIHGPSGIGKSALAQRFLDQALERSDVVVLRGRCYEHESVPYKALDGVIDSLTQYLGSLNRPEIETLLPRDVLTLSRLFPVMLQVPAVAGTPQLESGIADPVLVRQRAFAALRELLTGIAQRQPLVLSIDDLHWADADSVLLLEELLRPPQSPSLLMLVCFRTEEIAAKRFLQRLIAPSEANSSMVVALAPMNDEEARLLVASLIPAHAQVGEAEQVRIIADASGNPFLLEQLARCVSGDTTAASTFVEMLEGRLRALPPGARRFLETLAVCGRPVPPKLVYEASGLAGDERPLVTFLRSDRLVRSSGSAERVEIYHDRMRDALAAQLSADAARRIHGLMARTLGARGADDPEALCAHYRGAGEDSEASIHAALAAQKADAALAFDRAALFYRLALDLAPDSPHRAEWTEGLAGALAKGARPTEAAESYLEAAGSADAARRVELQRRAAEQLLIGGHIDRGLDVIRAVVSGVGIHLATGSRTALVSFLLRRALLRWRGFAFVERRTDQIPAADLLRIDTCWSLSTGLALVDNILAADFHTRHLLLALAAGEPRRIASGLAMEAGFSAVAGGPARRRTARVASRARSVAERSADPRAIALCTLTEGVAAYLVGEWRKASERCGDALRLLQDRCVGVTWELNFAQNVLLASLVQQGQIREVSQRLPIVLASARERGNRYIETELHTIMIATWLAADDPDGAERQASDIMARWAHSGFHRQHHNYLVTRIRIALYRSEAERAWQLLTEHWRAVKRSHGLRMQWMRIEARFVRARAALLMAATSGDRQRFLAIAQADVRRIEREKMAWSDPIALLLDACVAHLQGDVTRAGERLASAIEGFERADMKLYAAVARRRLGTLPGSGRPELLRQSDEWFSTEGVKNPDRMTRSITPGF
jgi:hypothetical protein